MKHTIRRRLLSLLVVLAILSLPAAQALTTQQAGELLEEYYIDPVPEQVLSQPTVEAMLEALGDPYTQYFTAEEYQAFLSSMVDQDITGIGVLCSMTDEGSLILEVYDNSPAQAGGLAAGDLITAVDGTPIAGLALEVLSGMLQGQTGTTVDVTYRREGQTRTVTLTRAQVIIPSTDSELLEGHVGYISCTTFGGDTVGHFTQAFETYGSQADRWIVDLRDNPGGEVAAAIDSAGAFTGQEPLAYLQDSTGACGVYGSNSQRKTEAPVIVLTNGGSASASELFAAGIQDYNRGIVVGERTYGKGVGQIVLDESALPDYFTDGDGMKITTFRFYSASGSTTDTVGIIPDLVVPDELAPAVALLLSASDPGADTEGYARLDMGWRWYIDLEQGLADGQWRAAFTALLEAIPPETDLYVGTQAGWTAVTPRALAEELGLEDYRSRSFSDSGESPFAVEIDTLGTYGIVTGSGDGSFDPAGTLTRAQLCALLAQALHCKPGAQTELFDDVPAGSWYAQSVNALTALGLVEGTGDGLFRPDDPVTHEQFITIAGRLAQRLNLAVAQSAQEFDAALLEQGAQAYAGWAQEGLWTLTRSWEGYMGNAVSLLWAPLDEIAPQGVTTREEAAALLCSLLTHLEILPS